METEILDSNINKEIRNVEYAGFGVRLGASLLDMVITIIPIGAFMYFGYENKSLMLLVVGALLGMLYKPVMEGVWGATLGKMILGITVVDSDLDIIDLNQSIKKNGIYIISSAIGIISHFWLANQDAFQESEGIMEAMQAGQGNPYGMVSGIWSLFIIVSCFAMLASSTKQTLHDRIADTYCVKNSM